MAESISSTLAGQFPDADVQYTCTHPGGSDAATSLGAWLRSPRPSAVQVEETFNNLGLLEQGETFAIYLSSDMLNLVAQLGWASMPKTVDTSGASDPDGPIQLKDLAFSYMTPSSAVVTEISGVDTTPAPDVPFTLTITDQISAKNARPTVVTTSHVQADPSWVTELEDIIAATEFLSVICASLVIVPLGFLVELLVVLHSIDNESLSVGGVGAAASRPLLTEVPIPKATSESAQTLVFTYDQVQVTDIGIVAGGLNGTRDRVPGVQISGPGSLDVVQGGSAQGTFQVSSATDLRPPVSYHWSAAGSVASQGSSITEIYLSSGTATAGTVHTTDVSVTATDADGLTATASSAVKLSIQTKHPGKPGFPGLVGGK